MKTIIQVKNLRKSYGQQPAVDNISFDIKKGQTFALLGPNGAGKSTVINILSTSAPKNSGRIIIDGLTPGHQNLEIRKRIGIVFQNGVLDHLLTVEENLYIRGSFYGLKGKQLQGRISDIAQMTGIQEILQRPYGHLSGGQQRRCDIARALLHFPKILFLDEPTTGLDPEIRVSLWKTIREIKEKTGMTVVLTTHYMEEATLADHIIIMKEGKIIASGSPAMLKDTFARDQLVLFPKETFIKDCPILSPKNSDSLPTILNRNQVQYHSHDGHLTVPLFKTLDALPLLNLCRGKFSAFEVQKGNMDSAYLSIIEGRTGHA